MQWANIVQRNIQRQTRDNSSKESAIVASFPFPRVHRFAPEIPLISVISEGRAGDSGFRTNLHLTDSLDLSEVETVNSNFCDLTK